MDSLALRIAARYQEAREFSSPEALKNYLKEHPQADPSKHHVQKSKGDKGKDEGHGKPHGFLGGLRGALKSISKGAKDLLTKAPEKAQKFFADSDHRKEVLKSAGSAIKKAPGTYAKKLVETAKHEVHEFKTAGGAVKDLLKGKKLNDEQKHAVKTVATHMAITAAAAALTSTGVFAGAAFMGKAMAKHIALKAASAAMGDLHVLGELGHVGHGVAELFSKFAAEEGKELDPEDALAALVMKKVQEELEKLGEDGLAEALEGAVKEKEASAIARRFAAETAPTALLDTMDSVVKLHSRLQGWIRRAPKVLADAQKASQELGDSWVWQDEFVRYWGSFESYETELQELDDRLDDIYLSVDYLSDLANMARDATRLPEKARIEHVLNSFKFMKQESTGRDHITYEVKAIKEWMASFEKWSAESVRLMRTEAAKAKRRIQRRQP